MIWPLLPGWALGWHRGMELGKGLRGGLIPARLFWICQGAPRGENPTVVPLVLCSSLIPQAQLAEIPSIFPQKLSPACLAWHFRALVLPCPVPQQHLAQMDEDQP